MYCHNCGTETTDHQTYCTDCGAELVYQSPSTGPEQETTVTPPGSAEPGSSDHEDTEQRTDHQENARSSEKRSPEREQTASETAQPVSTTASDEPDRSDQARELASNALFGYSFIILFRLTGISGILFQPHAENPFFATALHDIGVFVFYDGFLLAITAFLTSAYLTARHHLDLGLPADTRSQLDTVATIGLSGSSLLYILGIVVSGVG
jgi:hypothetical protein